MNTETITPEVVAPEEQSQLLAVVQQNALPPVVAQSLQSSFAPLFAQARKVIETSRGIHVTDASQKLEIKLARECRLALRAVRVAGEKCHKALKDQSVREGRAIDGFKNILLHLTETEEQRLDDQEKFVERREAERKETLKVARTAIVVALAIDPNLYALGDMTEETFQTLVEGTKLARAAAAEAARKAEADRIAREAAEQAERERVRQENERLKREADEKEAVLKAEREAAAEERRKAARAEEVARQERAEAELAARIERERDAKIAADKLAEVERVAKAEREAAEESARKEKLRLQAIAEVERQKAETARKEALAKHAAEVAALAAKAKSDLDVAAARHAEERRRAADQIADERRKLFAAEKAREATLQAASDLARKEHDAAVARKAMEAEALRKAAAAPSRDKLLNYANAVRALEIPTITTQEGAAIKHLVIAQRDRFIDWIEMKAGAL